MSKIKQGMPTWLGLRERARQAMVDIKRGRQETQVGPGNKVQSSMEAERKRWGSWSWPGKQHYKVSKSTK